MFTFTNRVPAGFGLMIWQLDKCGGVQGVIARCHQYKIDGVFLKGADGGSEWTNQFTLAIVKQFHDAGISVIGWQYVYGGPGNNAPWWSTVDGETAAAKYILSCGADGYLFDDEVEEDGKAAQVAQMLKDIRAVYPNASLGYNPYPYPSSDLSQPWWEYNNGCDYCLPQLYVGQDNLGNPATALQRMEADFAHWSPIWAARPGGRAAIPNCIDWQGASWPGAEQPDSFIVDAANVSLGKYPLVTYWDMDSLTPGEWAAVQQASQIWHGGTTSMWTRQPDGSGVDAEGHKCGSGAYDFIAAHGLLNSEGLAPDEQWDPAHEWGQVPLKDALVTIHRTVAADGGVNWDISDNKAGYAWWSASQQIAQLQQQVHELQVQLDKAQQPTPVDPTIAAEAAAGRALKAAIASLLATP